jgi:hypothetical protein
MLSNSDEGDRIPNDGEHHSFVHSINILKHKKTPNSQSDPKQKEQC